MIAGIVLAAGQSRRMGEPKALLRLGGRTFLQRAVEALRAGGCDWVGVVVGGPAAPASGEVAAEAAAAGAAVVVNPLPASEQVDSLRAGLRALPADAAAAVILPVDVPEADAATVGRVLEAFQRTGAPVVVPTAQGRHGHPVLFARTVWPELLGGTLAEGARTVVHAHAGDRVEVPVTALPADVDTPEDFRRLTGAAG